MPLPQRRVCPLCGRVYAIVPPEDHLEREHDTLCQDCARPPAPPEKK